MGLTSRTEPRGGSPKGPRRGPPPPAPLPPRPAPPPGPEILAFEVSETATLSVFDRYRLAALCIDRVEASQPLRLSLEVGALVPLHAGAASKALLAFLGGGGPRDGPPRPPPRLPPGRPPR